MRKIFRTEIRAGDDGKDDFVTQWGRTGSTGEDLLQRPCRSEDGLSPETLIPRPPGAKAGQSRKWAGCARIGNMDRKIG